MNDPRLPVDLSGLPEDGLVVIGLSGGADSMALTHYLLHHIDKNRICCAHVNHMLRGSEADRDEAASAQFCKEAGLRFALFREDIRALARTKGIGEEECGRQVRYRCFSTLLTGESDRIVTAHNANDNAETLLFHLARGTGLAGLCGIPRERDDILRPLLSATRGEIETYCHAHGLPYVHDSSNDSPHYARNRIRREVVPQLLQIDARFVEHVTALTKTLQADANYIAYQAEALLEQAAVPGGLSAAVLLNAHQALQTAALKRYLRRSGCTDLARVHIEGAQALLQTGGRMHLPGNLELHCSCGVAAVSAKKEKKSWKIPVLEEHTVLPCGKVLTLQQVDPSKIVDGIKFNNLLFKNSLDYDTITKALYARNRRESDVFSPVSRGHTKSLKKLLLEMRVPANRRDEVALLEMEGTILFVEGAGVAEGFQVTGQTKHALLVKFEDE